MDCLISSRQSDDTRLQDPKWFKNLITFRFWHLERFRFTERQRQTVARRPVPNSEGPNYRCGSTQKHAHKLAATSKIFFIAPPQNKNFTISLFCLPLFDAPFDWLLGFETYSFSEVYPVKGATCLKRPDNCNLIEQREPRQPSTDINKW